jgi:MFS family permease
MTTTSVLRPTRARQWVIVFAMTLAVITYIDRVCISQAAPDIQRDLDFTKEEMAWVFGAFTLAYALFEIPGGWLGDKIGPRKVLMRVVVMWSLFTALTGWAWNLVSMIICRFFFGAGEAGCFPNLTKAFTIWLPRREQVRAQGITWLSARWGGAFTPLLVIWVFTFMSWRWAFVLFGSIGVIWAIIFYLWFRDDPGQHSAVNDAELALMDGASSNLASHQPIPWGVLLTSRTVWMLWLQYACMSYSWYFYITWLPTYLNEARGVSLQDSALFRALTAVLSGLEPATIVGIQKAFLAGIPLFAGGIGCILSGLIAARVARRVGTARARRGIAYVGLVGAAAGVMISPYLQSPELAMLMLGLSSFCQDIAVPASWGVCMDVGGRFAGSLSGSMNMMGNIGGFLSPIAVAQILKHTGDNWTATFWAAGCQYLLGAVAWTMIDPATPLESAPQDASAALAATSPGSADI